ncbi:hypothetical protein Brsp05_04427 [Brucella sp. NBRC 12953]|uniref:hypothetical protein n=1 Tax=Brucella sp. NBRC 12953 TaxID=3075481 RepID=UPI0030ACDF3A
MIGPEIRCCQASTLATLLRSRADTQIDYAVEVIQPPKNVIAATAQNFFLESSTSAFVGGYLSSRWLGWSPSLHVHVPVKRNTQSGLTSIDLVRAQHPTEPAKPLEKLYSSAVPQKALWIAALIPNYRLEGARPIASNGEIDQRSLLSAHAKIIPRIETLTDPTSIKVISSNLGPKPDDLTAAAQDLWPAKMR